MLLPRDPISEEKLAPAADNKVKQFWLIYYSNQQYGSKREGNPLLEYNNYFNIIYSNVYPDNKKHIMNSNGIDVLLILPIRSSPQEHWYRISIKKKKKKRTFSFINMVQPPK